MPEYVCNTSPLIYLHAVSLLEELRQLVGSMLVPGAVESELAEGARVGYSVPDLSALPWIEVVRSVEHSPRVRLDPLAYAAGFEFLGAGEVEAISLALRAPVDRIVILDDLEARTAASKLGLRVVGTVGLIIRMGERGLVTDPVKVLDGLDAAGFRMSGELRAQALRLMGA